MAQIYKFVDKEKDMTVIKVEGNYLYEHVIAVIRQFYGEECTLYLLFDLTNAIVSELTSDEIKKIAEYATPRAFMREGGKTAFVLSSDLGFGLARMYGVYSEMKNHPIPHQVFRNMDKAKRWLEEG